MGTGGGPSKKHIHDLATERVLDLIQTRVSGFINCFDSDGTQILATASTSAGTSMAQEFAAQPTEYETNVSGSQSQTEEGKTGESTETTCTETATTFTVDWGQYTPAMLRGNKNPLLMPPPSTSPDVQNQPSVSNFDTQECQATGTPPRVVTTTGQTGRSRRRPILRQERETESLNNQRLNLILNTNTHAEEEHNIQMNILHLKERKEEEILKQEMLKTEQEKIKLEILQLQLKKLKD